MQNAGFFGEGLGRVHIDDLACDGSERRLQDCPHSGIGDFNCRTFDSDVGVVCPGMHIQHVPNKIGRD